MEQLSTRQEEFLIAIKKFVAKNGFTPTVRELCEMLGLNSPATSHFHLNRLEAKGYIKRNKQKSRAIELLVPNEYLDQKENVVDVALIGMVTAGNPVEAIERPDEYISLPTNVINSKKEVFALNVEGTSMINKGILNGDIVIVERKNDANNGDIVVAMTSENEVTLKTFYKEKDHIRLQPENDTMKPIILNNATILGKAIGLYRTF